MTDTSSANQAPDRRGSGPRRTAIADQARVVRRYLSAIESGRPGRGSKRLADAIGNRITKVDELLVSADPLTRVHLTQERIELHAEQVRIGNGHSPATSALEREFVHAARSYGDRHGITYAAWRQVGVDAKVLERAGIHKAERKPPPAAVRAAAEKAAAAEDPTEASSEPSSGGNGAVQPDPPSDAGKAPGPEASPTVPPGPHGEASTSISELALLLADDPRAASEGPSTGQSHPPPVEE